jgi:2-polyprenyl-6-methoxyphenol hydroxylase-like FAD-dependent oxidoreductase
MFDVVVVGARCAGAATAMLLGRRGHRVLLVDRAAFPSDTMSTLYIHVPGVALLQEWGVLNAVVAAATPRLDHMTYEIDGLRLRGTVPRLPNVDGAYAPRRCILDQLLVDAAVKADVQFRDRTTMVALLWDDGRVAGARMRQADGREYDVRARLVVGADGMRSGVARMVQAPEIRSDPRLSCAYYRVWRDLPAEFETYEAPGVWIAVIPTNDRRTVVAAYRPQPRFSQVRTDPALHYRAAIDRAAPGLAQRMRTAAPAERLVGTGDQLNFFRQAWGPGWSLVGDAGYHKDTITARGITDALRQADMLARAIGEDLRPPALDAALAGFATARDAEFAESYRNTLALARLTITPARLRMMQTISESVTLTQLYFAVVAGVGTMDDLLTPELIETLG